MSFDWLAVFKYVRPAVLAGAVLVWLAVMEPIFSSVSALSAFDTFVAKRTIAWMPAALHLCIAYLATLLLMHAWSIGHAAHQRSKAHKAEARKTAEALREKANIYANASPEEKLILRVFIDNGISSTGAKFLGEYLRSLVEAATYSHEQMGVAVSRLQARDLLHYYESDPFHLEDGYSIAEGTFAFLSANPNLIGSTAPVRLMFSLHSQVLAG